jgi:hypothetical protein
MTVGEIGNDILEVFLEYNDRKTSMALLEGFDKLSGGPGFYKIFGRHSEQSGLALAFGGPRKPSQISRKTNSLIEQSSYCPRP